MPRGGSRPGAGRKAGVPSAKTVARLEITQQAAETGETPLAIMLANMRHFHKVAIDAEAVLERFAEQQNEAAELEPAEQFKAMLAEVKKAAGLRQMAQSCASDAAPYFHPKLASTSVELGNKDDKPFAVEALSPTEAARRIAFALARGAPPTKDKP